MFKHWLRVSATVLAVGLAAVGCSSPEEGAPASTTPVVTSSSALASSSAEQSTSATPTSTAEENSDAATGEAMAALETLAVKGRAPRTGYDRENFGPAWSDTDRNGCDTRNDILARDLKGVTFRPGTHDCIVLTGVLDEPYTATQINFVRGQDTSTAVQIDHVVALADAWQKGAQQLDEATRLAFANDPLNLLAVDGPANMQKSAGDAATWLPANRAFRCDYVARQISVKATYNLWVTKAEKDAMARVLADCPGQTLPTEHSATKAYEVSVVATQEPTSTAPAPVAEQPVPEPAPAVAPAFAETGTDPQFSSCKKAKAAGYGPYVAGVDPEYAWYRDGDNDGINCE